MSEYQVDEPITTSVTGCARCGQDHGDLEFLPLAHGVDVEDTLGPLTHYATCPTNGEPILMRIVPTDTPDRPAPS